MARKLQVFSADSMQLMAEIPIRAEMLAFHVYSRRFANSIGSRSVQQRDRSRCTFVQASPNYRRIQASGGNRHISEIVRQLGLAVTIAENRSLDLNVSGLDAMHWSELIRGDVMISPPYKW
jgi:hypothetical protein